MKALVWEAPHVLTLRELAAPIPQDREVLIQVARVGICGSELSGYLGHNKLRVPPIVMGHEFAGMIVATGAGVSDDLRPGIPVTVNPMVFCGSCRYCQRGQTQLCVARRLIGAHRPGAFAEYVAVPAGQVFTLPADLSPQGAALAEPAAVAVRIALLADVDPGDTALVLGAGPIGLLSLQTLRHRGADQVFIADLSPERLAIGAALGGVPLNPAEIDVAQIVRDATGGIGAAAAVDAVGTAATRAACIGATRSAGVVVLSGLHEERCEMPVEDIIRREIRVFGSFCYTQQDFADALDELARRRLRLDPWVVEAPLGEGGAWFERLISTPGSVAKVLLVP